METESQELEVMQQVSPDVVYLQDKAQIDVQISTAKAYPRNVTRATQNSIAIATMDVETAQTCTYSVPRGGKAVTGPSVHMAKILAQNWGNLRVEAKVVEVGQTQITSEAVCFDLENNLAIKTQVKRSIIGKKGRFNDDMITVTGNAANAIALRNAIFAVIPRGVVDKVYNSAKAKITGDVSDETKLIARRKQVFDALKDNFNVTEAEILKAVGKAAMNHVTSDDIVVLIGIGTAIRDGDTTVDQAFRNAKTAEPAITADDLQSLFDEKKSAMNADQVEAATRIIETKESVSYQKLYNELNAIQLPEEKKEETKTTLFK